MKRILPVLAASLSLAMAAQGLMAQERIATNNTYNEFPRWTVAVNALNQEDGSGNRKLPDSLSMGQDFRNVLHVAGTLSVSGGGRQVYHVDNDWLGRRANGFSTPYQVSSAGSGKVCHDVEVAVLSDGTVAVIWVEPQSGGTEDVKWRTRSASGSWGSVSTGITGASGETFTKLNTTVRGTDIHMTFVRSNGSSVKLEYVKPTSSWSTSVVSDSASTSANAAGSSVAVDESGNLFVVYQDHPTAGGEYARYRSKASGGSWSSSTNIAQDGYSPDVAVDSSGNAHIIYVKGSGANTGKVYHRVGMGGSDTHIGNTTLASATFEYARLVVDTRNRPNVLWCNGIDVGYGVKVGSSWTLQDPIQEPSRGSVGGNRGTTDWGFGTLDLVINPFDGITWIDTKYGQVCGMYEPNLGSQDSAAEFHMGPGGTVNGTTGNLHFRLPLFSSKGVGFATKFSLLHNSLEADWGTLSNGWSHNYNMYLIDGATGSYNDQDSITVVFPDGSRAIFRYSEDYEYHIADDEYGVYSAIVRSDESSSTDWVYSTYLLTTKFGIQYEFRADGKLLGIYDANSNVMLFHYAGDSGYSVDSTHPAGALVEIEDSLYHLISSQSGRKTKLAYNSDKQLASVQDPKATSANYTISYDSGKRVSSVTFTGVSGVTWSFSYHTTNHTSNGYRIGLFNLVKTPRGTAAGSPYGSTYLWYQDNRFASVTDPSVSVITSCTADQAPSTDSPVHGLDYTDPTSSFSNPNTGLPGTNTVPIVSHIDPCGRTTAIEYQYRRALVDNVTDPLDNYAIFTHDGTYRNVTFVTDKRGYVTKYTYDTSAAPAMDNLWKIERPNADGSGYLSPITLTYTTDGFNNLASRTDARGYATSYGYSAYGNLTSVTYPNVTLVNGNTQTAGESWTYTTRGRVQTWTDPEGGVTTYSYEDDDMTGLVTKVQEDGQSTSNAEAYEYTELGHLKKVFASPNNLSSRVTEYVRDGLYRVTTVKDELANETVFTIDANSNVTQVTNRRSKSTSFSFDARDQLISVTQPSPGGTTSYVYDREGRLRRITNGRGFTTVKLYDELGRVAEVRHPGERTTESGGSDMVMKYDYDDSGNLTSALSDGTTDRETTFTYDARNNRTAVNHPVGSLNDGFVYDANDNLLATNRKDGSTFKSGMAAVYDQRDRVIKRYQLTSVYTSGTPTGVSVKILHDKNGNVKQVWNPNATSYGTADSTAYTYDDLQRLTQITNGVGTVVRQFVYYEDNSLYRIQGQEPQVGGLITIREFEYSKRGELTRDEDALGYADVYTYDAEGSLLTRTDKRSVVTDYEYWDTDWLKTVTLNVISPSAMDIVSQYAYDENGNLETLTVYNPATGSDNAVYTRYYDEADRLEKLTNPNTSHYQKWTYNDHGDLATHRDANAKVTTYTCDALGRVTEEEHGSPFSVTITRQYYGATRLVTVVDDETRMVETNYTVRLLPSEVEWVVNSVSFKTIAYGYDDAGNVTSQSDPDTIYPVTYTYDDDNRLETITKGASTYATFEFDAGGRKSELTYSNGYRTVWTYTNRDEIEEITLYNAATPGIMQAARVYAYDVRGQVTEEERTELYETVTYTYDDAGRVIAEDSGGNVGGGPMTIGTRNYDWTYDRGNNRMTQTRLSTPYGGVDESIEYTYNSEGLLTGEDGTVDVENPSPPPAQTTLTINIDYAYDANGNRTSKSAGVEGETETYAYDHLNRLSSHVTDPSAGADRTVTFSYMPSGHMLSESDDIANTTTWYMRDRMAVLTDYTQVGSGSVNRKAFYVNHPFDGCTKVSRIGIASGITSVNYLQDRECSVVATHATGVVSRRIFDAHKNVPVAYDQGEPQGPDGAETSGSREEWAYWCGSLRKFTISWDGRAHDPKTGLNINQLAPDGDPCLDLSELKKTRTQEPGQVVTEYGPESRTIQEETIKVNTIILPDFRKSLTEKEREADTHGTRARMSDGLNHGNRDIKEGEKSIRFSPDEWAGGINSSNLRKHLDKSKYEILAAHNYLEGPELSTNIRLTTETISQEWQKFEVTKVFVIVGCNVEEKIAKALVDKGVNTVVTFSENVTDSAASSFAGHYIRALERGMKKEEARTYAASNAIDKEDKDKKKPFMDEKGNVKGVVVTSPTTPQPPQGK